MLPETPRDDRIDTVQHDLDTLLRACEGTSRHDQAIVCISLCIDAGLTKGPEIIEALGRTGFNKQHVGKVLHDLSGSNPVRYRWWRDDVGDYYCHPEAP